MNVIDYLHFLTTAKSLEELWSAHTEQMAGYGFNRLLYGCTRYRNGRSLGDPEDFIILSNHSPAYHDGFMKTGLYFHAPMLNWALENEGSASWQMVRDLLDTNTITPEQRRVFEFNHLHGVTVGYTVSFNSHVVRAKGAISLSAPVETGQAAIDEMWRQHGRDIQLMNNVAHLRILTLPYRPPNRALTNRQREALQWVGDGKTTQDIAMLMGLTPATVEKRLRLAREALSVETTAQAVLKASLLNQMFMVEN